MQYFRLAIAMTAALVTGGTGAGERLPEVSVEGSALPPDTRETSTPAPALDLSLPADGGEALRSVTGVSGSRMGGHGIDPVIRGQSQTQLNILLDGAFVHGGCPNRMDPPTAYSPIDSYDQVTVLKGVQSVQYGSGGSGGTVLLERRTPRFGPDESLRARASSGYQSNSDSRSLTADVAAGSPQGFARTILGYHDAGNYQDGEGRGVRSAYRDRVGTLMLGYTPDDQTRLELEAEGFRERDVLFAGAGMDGVYSDHDLYRLRASRTGLEGMLSALKLDLYRSDVKHLMDNYSLRPLTAPMKMRVPTSSDTSGGRISGELPLAGGSLTLGLDLQRNERQADRFAGPAAVAMPTTLQSIMWPGVELHQTGLFAELELPLGEMDNLRAGLRYDHVTSEAGRAGQRAATVAGVSSPNDLYRAYYGRAADDHEEDNLGGLVRYEHGLGNGDSLLFVGLSRSVRTADATERYLAANAAPAADGTFPSRWVGNPGLAPEKHHQIEIGLSWDGGPWKAGASLFQDWVDDFILRDRAHGQTGILRQDNATIYRNVSARLWGMELEGTLRWSPHWSNRLGLAYVQARNTSDRRWIAQIPPLEGSLALDYQQADWRLGATLRFAAEQDKVDTDILTGSGLDANETPGWAVLDLMGEKRFGRHLRVQAGVENLLDTTYAYHVNRANVDPFNPEVVQVNEPGRALWVKVTAEY